MQKFILSFLLAFVSFFSYQTNAQERKFNNYDFISKGTWMVGGQFSFATNNYDNYNFFIFDNWEASTHNFEITPYVMYAFKKNTGVGLKISYNRQKTDLGNISLSTDDESLSLTDKYDISHMFYSTAFLRNYLGLDRNSRFGLYVDTELTYGYGQGKSTKGVGDDRTGTYSTTNEFKIGVTPGLTAFINENASVELFIDLIGFGVKNVDQKTNQVEDGSYTKTSADLKIDLLSIGFAVSVYF